MNPMESRVTPERIHKPIFLSESTCTCTVYIQLLWMPPFYCGPCNTSPTICKDLPFLRNDCSAGKMGSSKGRRRQKFACSSLDSMFCPQDSNNNCKLQTRCQTGCYKEQGRRTERDCLDNTGIFIAGSKVGLDKCLIGFIR